MGVYGVSSAPVGSLDGAVPAVRAPDGAVPVSQLHYGANGSDPDVVPAPPRTNREAIDPRDCVKAGCRNHHKKGSVFCGPHEVAHKNAMSRAQQRAEELTSGNATAD